MAVASFDHGRAKGHQPHVQQGDDKSLPGQAQETAVLDLQRYTTLHWRAASAVMQPRGLSKFELRQAFPIVSM
ncbi:MAG: hypothetical protein CL608_07020 [Anaerolineaceae bacterium]|nr:hypothetical protein [Anaerolineaceae bacterium]